jgi:hypothetical protein
LRSESLQRVLRGLVFVTGAAFIALAPAYGQIFGGTHPFAPRWIMFSGKAFDLFEVRFETVDATGARIPLDRFEALGYARPLDAPRQVLTLRSEREASQLARRICRVTLGAPLYMHLRKATRRGWAVTDEGRRDHCARGGRTK